ncbi:MAG: hypothetical protein DRI90_23030 [Deltaproteobacteria bacterium]|nr:MAG: hypothetical protein DRI90_23030 [Deltaproteobacteria bacterium]
MRLRDLLATLEVSSLLGAADNRVRGLGEQLQFACMALPCDEALVALELAQLGRLRVPGIATAEAWRAVELDFLPSGTPFAYLLGGGGAFAAELEPDDAMLQVLSTELSTSPRYGLFVPIRVGGSVLGGAALLRDGKSIGDSELAMAERLAEVLALTIESYRTEQVLLQLFATALPDLCAPDALTGFMGSLGEYIHQLRLSPEYRNRLELAEAIGRVAASGSAETRLATGIIERVEDYIKELGSGAEGDGVVELPYDLLAEEPGD